MTSEKGAGVEFGAKIVRIGALDKESLDINFDNGCILIMNVELILELPGFEALAEDDRVYYPKTDGSEIYWRDCGRAIGVEEITRLAGKRAPQTK